MSLSCRGNEVPRGQIAPGFLSFTPFEPLSTHLNSFKSAGWQPPIGEELVLFSDQFPAER
jgi:hypothetical protein